jgi:hypothetical protein
VISDKLPTSDAPGTGRHGVPGLIAARMRPVASRVAAMMMPPALRADVDGSFPAWDKSLSSRVPVEPSGRSSGRPRVRAAHPLISLQRRGSLAGMASTQVSVPASWYSRMAACQALIRVLAMTTPGRSGATLDSNDRHHPDHRRVRGCHSYRSPDSAGRPAHAGAGRWSRCSAWTLEIPTSFVRSNCSANHGGLVVLGHPHEWVTERGGEWCICSRRPWAATRVFHAE